MSKFVVQRLQGPLPPVNGAYNPAANRLGTPSSPVMAVVGNSLQSDPFPCDPYAGLTMAIEMSPDPLAGTTMITWADAITGPYVVMIP